jgi:hypothetical protein
MSETAAILDAPTASNSGHDDPVLPPSLEPHLTSLLTQLVEDRTGHGGVELQLPRLDATVAVEAWDGPSLLAAVRDPDEDDPGPRVMVRLLCLLLKADRDLVSFDRRSDGRCDCDALGGSLREGLRLHRRFADELKDAISTAVLRGCLGPARVLARFKQTLPPLDALLSESLSLLREEELLRELAAAAAQEEEEERARRERDARPQPEEEEKTQQSAPPLPAYRPGEAVLSTGVSSRSWLGWSLLVSLLAITLSLHVHRANRLEGFPAIEPGEAANLVDLVEVDEVGTMLLGTVSTRWTELDYRTRTAQFARLAEAAADRGFPAVFLVDPHGAPVARWSKDAVAVVYSSRSPT